VPAEQILIDHDLLVTIAISVTGVLFASLGTLSFWLGRLLLNKLDRKIETGYDKLDSNMNTCQRAIHVKIDSLVKYEEENRKSTYHAHDRLTDHIEKHHTKD